MKYEVVSRERIATVWSGYGEINRLVVKYDGVTQTVVQKLIRAPHERANDEGHVRKLKSYSVERSFYALLSAKLVDCKIPNALEIAEDELILEDIGNEYSHEDMDIDIAEAKVVVRWIARFHACLWSSTKLANVVLIESKDERASRDRHARSTVPGVWTDGSYWCLAVRQKELAALDDRWRWIAITVDRLLADIPEHCKTILHGDLKSANIAFSVSSSGGQPGGERRENGIAVYDFQWSGKGVGVKDLAYFFTSSVSGTTLAHETDLLDEYYAILTDRLRASNLWTPMLETDLTRDNLGQWYALCLVDYYRFMLGWGTWGASLGYIKSRVDTIVREYGW